MARRSVPFAPPWRDVRACVSVDGGRVRIAQRDELPAQPRGDLLQAGPLLVRDGAPCFERALDPEGFSAGQAQFDSDITDGRHPRAALGLAPGRLLAVACDGRSRRDAGLTLEELAQLLASARLPHGPQPRRRRLDVARDRRAAAQPAVRGRGPAGAGRARGLERAVVPAALANVKGGWVGVGFERVGHVPQ